MECEFCFTSISQIPFLCFTSDIDFEYPTSSALGQGFADLLTELRTAFDKLATSKGDSVPYLLTAAVSAGPENYAHLVVPQMDKALDFWNLMVNSFSSSHDMPTNHLDRLTTTPVRGSPGQTTRPICTVVLRLA